MCAQDRSVGLLLLVQGGVGGRQGHGRQRLPGEEAQEALGPVRGRRRTARYILPVASSLSRLQVI